MLLCTVLLCLTSCAAFDDSDLAASDDLETPLMVDLAQSYLNQRGNDIAPLGGNYASKDTTNSTKKSAKASASSRSKSLKLPKRAEVDWKHFQLLDDWTGDVVLFPLKHPAVTGTVSLFFKGKLKKYSSTLHSKFLVKRCKGGAMAGYVISYLPDRAYLRRHPNGTDSLGYIFDDTDYTGFFFVSTLDGRLLHGSRYERGEEQGTIRLKSDAPAEFLAAAQKEDNQITLCLYAGSKMTRAGLTRNIGREMERNTCLICGGPLGACDCAVIIGAYRCEKCGKNHQDGYVCNACPLCKNDPCTCSQDPGGSDGNIGGTGGDGSTGGQGSGSGGWQGGGGGGSGSGSQSGNDSQTTPSYIVDPAQITKTAQDVCKYLTKEHGKYKAICNLSVQETFRNLFGELPSYMNNLANEMISEWRKRPQNWIPIKLSEAQELANKGYFVVVGWKNPNAGSSGHVAVVVPGTEIRSSSWGGTVPVILEMGKGRRYPKKGLNYGFHHDKKPQIEIFYYKK